MCDHHSIPTSCQEPGCDLPSVSLPHTKPSSPRTMAFMNLRASLVALRDGVDRPPSRGVSPKPQGSVGEWGREMRAVRPGSGLGVFVVQLVRQDTRLPETSFGGAWEAVKGAWKLLVNEEGIVTPPRLI